MNFYIRIEPGERWEERCRLIYRDGIGFSLFYFPIKSCGGSGMGTNRSNCKKLKVKRRL